MLSARLQLDVEEGPLRPVVEAVDPAVAALAGGGPFLDRAKLAVGGELTVQDSSPEHGCAVLRLRQVPRLVVDKVFGAVDQERHGGYGW